MPEVTITVPDEHVAPMLHNIGFLSEELGPGEFTGLRESELVSLREGLTTRADESERAVTAEWRAIRHVLGASLVDVGVEVHRLSEAARPSLREILNATARAEWLAKTIDHLEEA